MKSIYSDVYISAQVQVNDSTYQSRIIKWIFRKVSVPAPTDGYSSYGGYIPNRTQLRETDSTANRTVLFYNQSNAIATYIDNSKISYQLLLANDTTNADTTFRVDMSFAGGKGNAKIYPFNERKEYINYYLGHMDKPSIRTPLSNVILKQGVYTNTDVLFTSSPTGFRHWFLASTGATPSSYQMRFAGQTGLSVDGSGNLVITTTIGNITYKKAKAYSMNTTTGALTLLGWQPSYSISGSTVSFTSIGSWSGTLVLEIDEYKPVTSPSSMVYVQNLEWSTFFGGSGAETNWDVKNDAGGNVWYCGQTSDWIFPENSGTNIGEYHSMDDAYVVHFNNECEAVWFTFYGGWNFDRAYAIALDENKNTYCVGYTLSNDIPMIENTGMDDNTLNGYSDGFFLKLDDAGTILVDSYIGGNGADMAYDIDYRPAGGGMGAAIFIAGSGDSGINFPLQASPSAYGYNQSHAGGYDGFLMRLNGDCELEWSTFFGGSGDDFIYGIANVAGSPAIVGHTKTNYYTANACTEPNDGGFPTCVFPGAWQQPSYQSTHDYNFFIARFDAKDSLKYSTYHGKADLLGNAMRRPQIESFEKYYDSEGKYFFYVSGCTSGEAAADFPFNDWPPFYPNDAYYYTHDSIAYGSLLWLAMLYGNEEFITVEGCTALEWKDHSMNASMAMDKDGGLIITGSSTIQAPQSPANYCFLPTDGEFPLCDQGGTQYMENNLDASNTRSYIMHFDNLMRLDWSTQFGDRPTNFNTCVSSAGEYIFVGGYSLNHYTLLEFDENSLLDYYRDSISGADQDAVIARFKLPQYVGVNEYKVVGAIEKLLLYPNPTTGALNIVLPFATSNNDRIDILDVRGKIVSTQNIPVRSKQIAIDARLLASGMYIVRYNSNDKVLTQSFIKE